MRSFISGIVVASVAADTCYLPVDVYFLQDTTGSFIEDLPNVKAQIPSIVTSIEANNPGSYFGVGEFRDKPYLFLGELSDYCTKLNHPLSSDIESVQQSFESLFASGGGDLPEAQLAAVIDSVNDPLVGWRQLKRGVEGGDVAGARLIIMSTDAKPHDPGDYDLYPGTSPTYMTPYPDSVSGISANTLCRRYDYPSVTQMKAQLSAHNTYLAILTPDDDAEVTEKWRWINDEVLGNPSNFYQFIKNDSSDILSAIIAVLNSVTQYVCALTTTTTAAPLTTVTPTPTTTTTAAPLTTVTPTPTVTRTPVSTVAASTPGVTTIAVTTAVVTTTSATTTTTSSIVATTSVAPTSVATVTPVGSVVPCPEPSCPEYPGDHCRDPCYTQCLCCENYGMVILVNDKPKHLVVNYEG